MEVPEEAIAAAARALFLAETPPTSGQSNPAAEWDGGLLPAAVKIWTARASIAARVRAEERQRAQMEMLRGIVADIEGRYTTIRQPDRLSDWGRGVVWMLDRLTNIANDLAAGSAVPVATPQPYSDVPRGYHIVEDADGERLVRNSAQAFCGRLPGHLPHGNCGGYPPSQPVANPAEPVDEVVCPNCQHTIRARMSDQPGVATPTELDDGEHVKVFHQHEDGSEVEGRIRDCCGDDAPVPAGQDGRR